MGKKKSSKIPELVCVFSNEKPSIKSIGLRLSNFLYKLFLRFKFKWFGQRDFISQKFRKLRQSSSKICNRRFRKIRKWFKKKLKILKKLDKKFQKKIKKVKKKSTYLFLSRVGINFKRHRSVIFSVLFTISILGGAWWLYDFIFKDLPNPLELVQKEQIITTRILDRNGNLLFRIYKDENRTLIPLEQIPQHMINATVAIEDKTFYDHHGFSIQGIFRALVKNIRENELQGGSTLTQQLVKNRLLNSEKTLRRKARELLLAVLVESTYSKDEILQMYLNQVPYGGSTYGIEEAAWRYFNKPAKDLSLGESSLLAGLPAAPSVYTPFGPNPELSYRRQEEVLRRLVEDGYITLEQAYEAKQEELAFRQDVINIQAPHFVMYVKKLLADKFGEHTLHQGGLEVRTSLDLNLQAQAQQIVTQQVALVERLNITNGAALVTNPQTGEILAMVGSKDYFDFENDGQVNVTLRPRQPGSSIKPLTYALAFESGQQPWDFIDDTPITYHIPGSKPYSPNNYDGSFHGRVTLTQALANSYNVPAVKTLAGLGVQNLVQKGQDLGISTWNDSSRFGLSLTLGAGEVLMTDLAEVYGTFTNGGYTVELDPFLEISDAQGKILYRNQCFDDPNSCLQQQTLDSLAAYQITNILADNQARSQTFGRYSLLYIPNQEVAVKTGTTNNMRDNWTIGYTTNRLVGVWVGNNDNSSMSYVASGMTGASPIWNEIMRLLLNEENPHSFALPDDLIKVKICAAVGTLFCQNCPQVISAVYNRGEEPQYACNPDYFVQKEVVESEQPIGLRDQIL